MIPSSIPPHLTRSGLRAPEPSPIRVPRGTPPNSDKDDNDDDDDDVRLTHSQPRATAEAGHHHPNRDGPSSSSQPKADNTSVPAAAGVGTGTPNVPFSLSLTLRNTGSVARDHLASERTFLAYVRTSLSFASAGVALVQLFRVSVSASANTSSSASVAPYARPLGATLVGLGMAVLVMGTHRYFFIQRSLPRGFFPAARFSVFLQAVSLATLVGIVFGILVAVH